MSFKFDRISFIKISLFIAIISLWLAVSLSNIVDPLFIGNPINILNELVIYLASGKILPYLVFSLGCFALGLTLAIVFGVILGIAIAYNKETYEIVSPYIYLFDTIPKIILLPLIILAFSIGFLPMVLLVLIMSIVPIIINTMQGVRSADKELLEMAESFDAKRSFVLSSIIFLGSIPFIISGIRIARGKAITAIVVGEFFGLGEGLGYLISFHGGTFQTDKLFAVTILLVLFNYATIMILNNVENNFRRRRLV